MTRRRTVAAVATVAVVGLTQLVTSACCARRLGKLAPDPGIAAVARAGAGSDDHVELTYTGCGGWIMRWRGTAIVSDPFVSNPGFLRVGMGTIAPNARWLDELLPPVADVPTIIVGHAHYDHLMDVPYVATHLATRATIYASDTAAHILAAVPELRGRVVPLDARAGDFEHPADWIWAAEGAIRFMPLRSMHAPHWHGIKMYKGGYDTDLAALPRRASGWKEGQTLSYVVDFLRADGSIAFRLHFQDSASDAPIGEPPDLGDGKAFDAAILCGASFQEVTGYPDDILAKLHPRYVLVGHWEDFFIPPTAPLKQVRATNIARFVEKLDGLLPAGTKRILPTRFATYRLDPAR